MLPLQTFKTVAKMTESGISLLSLNYFPDNGVKSWWIIDLLTGSLISCSVFDHFPATSYKNLAVWMPLKVSVYILDYMGWLNDHLLKL